MSENQTPSAFPFRSAQSPAWRSCQVQAELFWRLWREAAVGVPCLPLSCVPVAVGSCSWWTHKLKMAVAPLPISALPDFACTVRAYCSCINYTSCMSDCCAPAACLTTVYCIIKFVSINVTIIIFVVLLCNNVTMCSRRGVDEHGTLGTCLHAEIMIGELVWMMYSH